MSKMYVILVILLVNKISAEDSSGEKYIDLLPEKEKEEFLQNIARRIFSGVQSKDDRDGVSGEVSETELNEHSAFVNQILKEESKSLRKNGVKAGNNDYFNHKTDENDEKILDKKDKQDDDAQLVDLTLRSSKREKRNSLTNTDEESKIVRISVGNDETRKQDKENDDDKENKGSDREDIQIKHFPRAPGKNKYDPEITINKAINVDEENDKDDSKEAVVDSQGKSEESVKDSKSLEKRDKNINESPIKSMASQDNLSNPLNDAISQESKEEKASKRIIENVDNLEEPPPKTNESFEIKSSKENTDKKSSVGETIASISISEHTTSDVRPTVVQTETLTIGDETTEKNKNENPNASIVRSNTEINHSEEDKKEDVQNINAEESKSNTNIEIVSVAMESLNDSNEAHPNYETKSESKTENETSLDSESNAKFLSSDDKVKITNKTDEHTIENNVDVTTLKTEVLTKVSLRTRIASSENSDNEKHETIKNNEEINKSKITDDKNVFKLSEKEKNTLIKNVGGNKKDKHDKLDMKSYIFVKNMIKVIRAKIKPDDNTNRLKTIPLYDVLKPKKYEVYEVSAEKMPYFKKQKLNYNEENPHYVPIYNYSPNNAYYNPRNKFGPNDDDNKDDIVDRSFENEKYKEESDGDDLEDKYDNDVSNVGFENNYQSVVPDELKKYGDSYKADKDPKLEKLIKGYTEYKNQRKFKFGKRKRPQNKKSSYKLKLPLVVQHAKYTDIILNPNDYLDMDYNFDRNEETPNIRSRCEISKEEVQLDSLEEIDTKNLKSHIRSVREMLFKQKIFGYVPTANTTRLDEKKYILNASKEALRTKEINDADDKNIAMDYFFGKTREGRNNNLENTDIYTREREIDTSDEIKEININNKENPDKHRKENEIKPVTPHSETELRSNKPNTDIETITEILSISDAKALLPTIDKLLNISTNDKLEPFVAVLENMMVNDAKALKQYDWLGTTVDLQSALFKLMNMADAVSDGLHIPHPDIELLKYAIYLHKSTKKIRKQSRKFRLLPRNRKKRRGIIKESGLLNRHWLFRMMAKKYDTIITSDDFDDFNDFLDELEYYLYDLHTAVQQIANVTKYNNQNWFENLKELYIDTKRKHLLEILLHVTTTRLLDLIENAAKNGVEEDFLTFVIKNEKYVKITQAEMTFAQKILDELMIG